MNGIKIYKNWFDFKYFLKCILFKTTLSKWVASTLNSPKGIHSIIPEINSFNKKMSSNPCRIKRPVLPFAVSSTMEVLSLLLIPEPLADQSSYKRTAKKFITLLPTFTVVVPVLQLILNSLTCSNPQTLSFKDWTVADKQESVHLWFQLPKCFTSIKVSWELTWLSVGMMFWVHTCVWLALRESTNLC